MISEILDTINLSEALARPPTSTDREIIKKHGAKIMQAIGDWEVGKVMFTKAYNANIGPEDALERAFVTGFLMAVSVIEDILTKAQSD